jgi:uncharacterized protein YlxP (DUF503 family)
MVVGWGIIDIVVEGSRSLKEKRSVVRRILGRTKNTFNVSIAEVGAYNDWKRCQIGFSVAGNERGFVQSKMDKNCKFYRRAASGRRDTCYNGTVQHLPYLGRLRGLYHQ